MVEFIYLMILFFLMQSLLDNQQVQKIAEKARLNSLESQVKVWFAWVLWIYVGHYFVFWFTWIMSFLQEHEVVKLKQQLDEFVEERQGWANIAFKGIKSKLAANELLS